MGQERGTPEFSIKRAHEAQLRLSRKVVLEDRLPGKIRLIAGVDVAYTMGVSIGAVAVLDYDSLELVESQTVRLETRMPYIPTLLSFREIPPAVLSIRRLNKQADVFLVDGQGYAHPYRCGFASHLGLVLCKPTIGVAKSRLIGEVDEHDSEKDVAFLRHKGEVIGAKVSMKNGGKPIYVSVGHMVSLETAVTIVRHCLRDYRVPLPVLKAHEVATAEKRKINIL